jgi:hypothetical protein
MDLFNFKLQSFSILLHQLLSIPPTTAMQQNVLEINVQYTTIPVGLICLDLFSGAYESYS